MSRTVIACLVCLLVAGCAAPTAQPQAGAPTPNATSTPDGTPGETSDAVGNETTEAAVSDAPNIPVSGGSLPFEPGLVFDRTADLLDVNVSPPTVIVVQSPEEIRHGSGGAGTPDGSANRSFVGVMGIGRDSADESGGGSDGDGGSVDDGDEGDGNGSDGSEGDEGDGDDGDGSDGVAVAAYTPSPYSVYVNERMTEPGRARPLERTVAHEFVHTVQFRQNAFGRIQRALDLRRDYSRDRYLTYVSVLEGAAVYTAGAYDRRYLEGRWATVTSAERFRASPSGVQYALARYYFGNRYLRHRFDSPSNLSAVYDDPPRTTEQLLHGDTPADAPAPLSVSTDLGDRSVRDRNVNGELFTRIALGTRLNGSRAADAAAGWGADRLVTVADQNRSFVWATRWDSRAEADEFEAALGDYLAARANRSTHANRAVTSANRTANRSKRAGDSSAVWRDGPLSFRVVRTDAETVVLLAGDAPFVRNATVTGTNATVSVETSSA